MNPRDFDNDRRLRRRRRGLDIRHLHTDYVTDQIYVRGDDGQTDKRQMTARERARGQQEKSALVKRKLPRELNILQS